MDADIRENKVTYFKNSRVSHSLCKNVHIICFRRIASYIKGSFQVRLLWGVVSAWHHWSLVLTEYRIWGLLFFGIFCEDKTYIVLRNRLSGQYSFFFLLYCRNVFPLYGSFNLITLVLYGSLTINGVSGCFTVWCNSNNCIL